MSSVGPINSQYVTSRYSTEYYNTDNPEVQAQIVNELNQAIADHQSVKMSLSQIDSSISYNQAQISSTTASIDNLYKTNPKLANDSTMTSRFDSLDRLSEQSRLYGQQRSELYTCELLLQDRISYLKSLLGGLNKLNPTYIPFNPKLESQDFNKIAHFRVLEPFHETLKGYLTPGSSIYEFKSELFYAAVDSDTSFRFTMMPLFIQSITYGSVDRIQVSSLMGDYFHTQFFGRAEQIITINAFLLDTPETKAFATITMLYMDFFRLTHVSRVGIPLTLEMGEKLFTGAFTSMNINKSSNNEDLLEVTFEFLVLEYTAITRYNRLPLPNVHTVTW